MDSGKYEMILKQTQMKRDEGKLWHLFRFGEGRSGVIEIVIDCLMIPTQLKTQVSQRPLNRVCILCVRGPVSGHGLWDKVDGAT